jgi:hypothetical protein
VGNGSAKHGDAVADRWRDEFAKNRAARRRARAALDSMPDKDPDADDTARIEAVMADSKAPTATRSVVGFLGVFPPKHRPPAAIILFAFILALVALGAAKLLGWA